MNGTKDGRPVRVPSIMGENKSSPFLLILLNSVYILISIGSWIKEKIKFTNFRSYRLIGFLFFFSPFIREEREFSNPLFDNSYINEIY